MRVALWAEIHRLSEMERLSEREVARRLHCSRATVKEALAEENPPVKEPKVPVSILDPHRGAIDALIAKCPRLSAVRVLEEIRKNGYDGEITLVRNYLRTIRPAPGRVYQEVEYRPGQAMQVDPSFDRQPPFGEPLQGRPVQRMRDMMKACRHCRGCLSRVRPGRRCRGG